MILATQMKLFAQSARHDAGAPWFGRWVVDATPSVHPAISIATTDDELNDIGRLRYDLYIDRDGKKYRNVDHAARSFIEPIDTVSLNFQARVDGELLASVRLVRAEDALLDPHLRLLVEAYKPASLETTVVCSRFAVRPENKARAMIKPMFIAIYRMGFLSGAHHCLLGTRSDLIEIFERFGFRRSDTQLWDPVADHIHVLDLDSYDLAHMQAINSPLVPEATIRIAEALSIEAPEKVHA